MTTLTIHKCHTLPDPLEPNCLYLIKGEQQEDLIICVTDAAGETYRNTLTRTEINSLLEANGNGILQVDELPEATPELAGRLYSLSGVNTPCWCTGTEWLDLSKASGVADPGTGEVTTTASKLYRNESVFGIKIL